MTQKLTNLKKFIEKRLNLILKKYEKLNLKESSIYLDLVKKLKDKDWIEEVASILAKVENSESIFYINKEITNIKNDYRVLEMFSEIDGARWLAKGNIDGPYVKITYLKKKIARKYPDFLAIRDEQKYPAEIKMLSPQDLDEKKFILKMTSKINNEAIPQLQSFFQETQFTKGLIIMWSHYPIKLEKIDYIQMKEFIKSHIKTTDFPIGIYMTLYSYGIWDFEL